MRDRGLPQINTRRAFAPSSSSLPFDHHIHSLSSVSSLPSYFGITRQALLSFLPSFLSILEFD